MNTSERPPPTFTAEQLDYLSSLAPDRCPEPTTPERDIWMASGAAHLVRGLRRRMEELADEAAHLDIPTHHVR